MKAAKYFSDLRRPNGARWVLFIAIKFDVDTSEWPYQGLSPEMNVW